MCIVSSATACRERRYNISQVFVHWFLCTITATNTRKNPVLVIQLFMPLSLNVHRAIPRRTRWKAMLLTANIAYHCCPIIWQPPGFLAHIAYALTPLTGPSQRGGKRPWLGLADTIDSCSIRMDDTETGVTCIVHGHRDVTDCSLSDSSGMDTSCVRWLISLSCLMDQGTYRLFSKHTPAAQHPLRRMRSSHLSLAEQRTRTRQCDVIIVISERARSAPALQRGSVSLCGRGRSTPKNSVFRPNLV